MASNPADPPPGDLWQALAVKAQGGDRRAYHRLLSEIHPYVRNILAGRLANPDWADDIAQDVLVSVHKSLHTYSADRPFRPWLLAIMNFRRTDFLRKHYRSRADRQAVLEQADFEESNVTAPAHAGELKDIEAALNELPPEQREIFTMIKLEGRSAQEVADQLGMSISAVKVSAHRSQKKLQDKLG